jgi:hypothetical protein
MLSKENYTKEHIEELQKHYPKVSLGVFEMTMYAFGLLQRLVSSKLDFVFKGGTSLMLLLPEPQRVSTDIDILVKPGTDLGPYIADLEHEFPLLRVSHQAINSKNGVQIAHYSFACPPLYGTEANVLLDVYFGSNLYQTVASPLKNRFLLNDGLPSSVWTPSIDSLLGDKLTAFAPKTIGVHPFVTSFGTSCDKRLQIIKQLYDINALAEEMWDFGVVAETYHRVVLEEKKLRGISLSEKDILRDSFLAALSILTLGSSDENQEYRTCFKPGIDKLSDHVFAFDWNATRAQECAAKAMLLYGALAAGEDIRKVRVAHRAGYHSFPYSSLNHSVGQKDLFDQAVTAIALFDPKAR